MNDFFKYMMAMTMFVSWAKEATKDGVIDQNEANQAVTLLLSTLGQKAEIKVKPILQD